MARKEYSRKSNIALFDSVFRHAPIGMALLDTSGRFLRINEALCELIGYGEAELLHHTFIDITYPDDIYKDVVHADMLLSGKMESYSLEKRYIHKKGHVVPVVLNGTIVKDGLGAPQYFLSYIRKPDREPPKPEPKPEPGPERQRQEALYRLIAEQSRHMLVYCSADGSVRFVSRAVTATLGYAQEEWIGKSHDDFLHPDDFGLSRAGETDAAQLSGRYRHKHGHYVWFECSVRIIRDASGRVEAMLALGHDITERQLAAEIARQMRKPLTSIRGQLQLLHSEEQERHDFDLLASELDRIESIWSELLVSVEPRRKKFAPSDIVLLLDQVTGLLEAQTNLTNIRLTISCEHRELLICCDESQIKQLFVQLIQNAIGAMPDGGDVAIEVKPDGARLKIGVFDKGPGIPESEWPRGDLPLCATGESGLGPDLAVTKHIVESHGGTIRIDSRPGWGTALLIDFPLCT